jgi:hypothetical protein
MEQRERWKKLRVTERGIEWTAHWPNIECGSNPDDSKMFWQRDLYDISHSDFVLVYAETEFEQLRGALVEAGIAIGLGVRVIVVGESHCYGTWQYHPQCLRATSIEHACWIMKVLCADGHGETPSPWIRPGLPRVKHSRPVGPAPLDDDDEIPF